MVIHHLIALSLAYAIDLLIGDPKWLPHPVRLIGKMVAIIDEKWNVRSWQKGKGILLVMIVIVVVFSITTIMLHMMYSIHFIAGIAVETIILSTTIAVKGLREAAMEVYAPLSQGQLKEARAKLSWIVGRDTESLEESEVVRGAVETVAENTSDAVTAPLFWALIGGAPLAMVYRAVNTCDSMVGYKNEKYRDFGWASARLDDVLNWIPSRITALVMILCNRPIHSIRKAQCFDILKRDAMKHPSPNSGWGEAAVAALLGVQLGGVNQYKGIKSIRAIMGDDVFPLERHHIMQSIHIMNRTVKGFIVLLWIGGMTVAASITWF
jgi:adenosylcobinamide-phosphate synthase